MSKTISLLAAYPTNEGDLPLSITKEEEKAFYKRDKIQDIIVQILSNMARTSDPSKVFGSTKVGIPQIDKAILGKVVVIGNSVFQLSLIKGEAGTEDRDRVSDTYLISFILKDGRLFIVRRDSATDLFAMYHEFALCSPVDDPLKVTNATVQVKTEKQRFCITQYFSPCVPFISKTPISRESLSEPFGKEVKGVYLKRICSLREVFADKTQFYFLSFQQIESHEAGLDVLRRQRLITEPLTPEFAPIEEALDPDAVHLPGTTDTEDPLLEAHGYKTAGAGARKRLIHRGIPKDASYRPGVTKFLLEKGSRSRSE